MDEGAAAASIKIETGTRPAATQTRWKRFRLGSSPASSLTQRRPAPAKDLSDADIDASGRSYYVQHEWQGQLRKDAVGS